MQTHPLAPCPSYCRATSWHPASSLSWSHGRQWACSGLLSTAVVTSLIQMTLCDSNMAYVTVDSSVLFGSAFRCLRFEFMSIQTYRTRTVKITGWNIRGRSRNLRINNFSKANIDTLFLLNTHSVYRVVYYVVCLILWGLSPAAGFIQKQWLTSKTNKDNRDGPLVEQNQMTKRLPTAKLNKILLN